MRKILFSLIIILILVLLAVFLPIYKGEVHCGINPKSPCSNEKLNLLEYMDYNKARDLAKNELEVADPFGAEYLNGVWKFTEVPTGSNAQNASAQVWEYTLALNDLSGTLNIDGFQTMQRMQVRAVIVGDGANIFFKSYTQGNVGTGFKPDDLLMTVYPTTEGALNIEWLQLRPNIENITEDPSSFQKQK